METRLLIRGEQVAGEGAELAVENPATEETVGDLRGASPEQVDAAIAGAREAAARLGGHAGGGAARDAARGATRMRAMTEELATALMSSRAASR